MRKVCSTEACALLICHTASADSSKHAFSGPRDEPIASPDILRFILRGAPKSGR
jgi:hypothetical protein